jgi:geranylgeranyl diphosphate synthase, type II
VIKTEFEQLLIEKKRLIDQYLPSYVKRLSAPRSLKESMLYSIEAGGKRLRPILTLLTIDAFGKNEELGLDVACAIELVHTYSLIHDDLPSMDNDDYRRGKLTNHKVYGDAVATLAGDALLTFSFELLANINNNQISSDTKLILIQRLARAAGAEGMVGGQVSDLEGENRSLSLQDLEYIHQHKTGDLLLYSVFAGALLADASKEQVSHLEQFAKHLGLAFQIKDDILDIEGDEAKLGKPVGSDEERDKSTYPKLLTLAGAKEKLKEEVEEAKKFLYEANVKHHLLEELLEYIVYRDH